MARISKSSGPGKAEVRESDAEVFAGGHPILGVDVAPRGGQLQAPAVGVEPEVGIELGQVGAGSGQAAGQADSLAIGVAEGARDGAGEVQVERPGR